MIRVLVFLLLGLVCSGVVAQDPPKQDVVQEVSANPFRRALLKAADAAAKKGELKRADVIRLRVATLSPAFLERAQELAVIQMSFSGEEVPVDENGKVDVSKIDFEKLLDFLERLLPLILKLISLFAFNGGGVYHAVA
jgi:hypothetical protein